VVLFQTAESKIVDNHWLLVSMYNYVKICSHCSGSVCNKEKSQVLALFQIKNESAEAMEKRAERTSAVAL
jgi:hypothetical protein